MSRRCQTMLLRLTPNLFKLRNTLTLAKWPFELRRWWLMLLLIPRLFPGLAKRRLRPSQAMACITNYRFGSRPGGTPTSGREFASGDASAQRCGFGKSSHCKSSLQSLRLCAVSLARTTEGTWRSKPYSGQTARPLPPLVSCSELAAFGRCAQIHL